MCVASFQMNFCSRKYIGIGFSLCLPFSFDLTFELLFLYYYHFEFPLLYVITWLSCWKEHKSQVSNLLLVINLFVPLHN